LINETVFTIIVLFCLGLPIASFVILILLVFFEKEFDYLQLENKKIEMENELHKMEYLRLSQQIQPHFLFNSLNALLSLGRLGRNRDIVYALEELAQFLRYRYKYADKEILVPFITELKITQNYLSIQKIRFGDRLSIEYHVDEHAKSTYIPPYLLQTFVENAFKHGLEKKRGDKRLIISLKREGSWVTLSVTDNGPGMGDFDIKKNGTGLENIRKRLSLLFDLHTEVSLSRQQNVTIARAIWPFTPEGEK